MTWPTWECQIQNWQQGKSIYPIKSSKSSSVVSSKDLWNKCVCVCLCVCERERENREGAYARSCPTLWDPIDYSWPNSSAHRIFPARILQAAAFSFSRGSSQLEDQTHVSNVSRTGRQILHHWATWEDQGRCGESCSRGSSLNLPLLPSVMG